MPQILDYKIVEEIEKNGSIVSQRVRYYEGAVTTQDEFDPITQTIISVTAYRRTGMVEEVEYTYG